MISKYKEQHKDFGKINIAVCNQFLDKRKLEAERIREKYPERIPVICEKSKNSTISEIDKTK